VKKNSRFQALIYHIIVIVIVIIIVIVVTSSQGEIKDPALMMRESTRVYLSHTSCTEMNRIEIEFFMKALFCFLVPLFFPVALYLCFLFHNTYQSAAVYGTLTLKIGISS